MAGRGGRNGVKDGSDGRLNGGKMAKDAWSYSQAVQGGVKLGSGQVRSDPSSLPIFVGKRDEARTRMSRRT